MNQIHPTALVGPYVEMGTGNTVGPFVVLSGHVRLGDDNWLGTGVVVGVPPEVRGHPHPADPGEPTGGGVVIGSRNTFREHAQVHGGWRGVTTVGDDAFVMNQVYVAHDNTLGDEVTLASGVRLAGHVSVQHGANLGMGVVVHQRRVVGAGTMVGMGAVVTRDVPPFAKAFGSPARVRGVNVHRLSRLSLADHADLLAARYAGDLAGEPAPTGDEALDRAWRDWYLARV
ncbi:MAG: acyl-ACP--UDP-N-acetylglucosamine O-acyltransferase [Nocardioidaceae bacterium]|nr:acyl-ACP--UDP-N-acetylglucosamine O-acyltransferase [Nocardioidaceae bacterium]